MFEKFAAILLAYFCICASAEVQTSRVFELLKSGAALTAVQVNEREQVLAKDSTKEEERIELLAYYASRPAAMELEAIKAARLRHILWLVQHDPKSGLGLFMVVNGAYRVNCRGDELADADGYRQVRELWVEQASRFLGDDQIQKQAVQAVEYCDPEKAESWLREKRNYRGVGELYATTVLGITGLSYQNNDPAGSDADLRAGAYAIRMRKMLEAATDRELLKSAAGTLLREGAILWSDGKLDWDYTSLGNALLDKVRPLQPGEAMLLTVPTHLPARGERPPVTLRVGGNVQAAKLARKVTARYPAEAKEKRVQGTVRMTALLGLDGKVLDLQLVSGPSELVNASLQAVRQWEYKPTLLNGKPAYIVTVIDVNYTISRY